MRNRVKIPSGGYWNYIEIFFKNIFNGCRDYVNMVAGKILWLQANVKFKLINYKTRLRAHLCALSKVDALK